MPTNIEVKAVLADPAQAEMVALQLSGGAPQILAQTDVFFACDSARLKLRILAPDHGELIRYQRTDIAAARPSHYSIARTSDPTALRDILSRTLGETGTVSKTRRLFLIGQTRVHLDNVAGLGDFLELEVVLRPGQSVDEANLVLNSLLTQFGIKPDQFKAQAYIDMLRARSSL